MKCLRCGYCCIEPAIMIVDNPNLGIVEGNVIYKPGGERCKHLDGDKPGKYTCLIHDKEWYNKTPCSDFGQIEENINDLCRIGEYMLRKEEKEI